jgi:hypothetical protein
MAVVLKTSVNCINKHNFVQLGFNLSNVVTDTIESSLILIYFETHISIYIQKSG